MRVVAFLHQKGGTGKSTLAVSAAVALAQAGHRVLLLDTDYQGTSSEWGNRHGQRFGLETRSQVQPIVHTEVARFRNAFEWVVVDGPPTLSAMTESILQACDRVVVPLRPAWPDVWAVPWLAAVVRKHQREDGGPRTRIVFNQYQGEDLAPLKEELAPWGLPVHGEPLPADPAFPAVFGGIALPGPLAERVLALVLGEDE